MSPDSLASLLPALSMVLTAGFGGIATVANARSKRATADVQQVQLHAEQLDRQVVVLQNWQFAARLYIATLRGVLADRGITAPEPPIELGLSVPPDSRTREV